MLAVAAITSLVVDETYSSVVESSLVDCEMIVGEVAAVSFVVSMVVSSFVDVMLVGLFVVASVMGLYGG